MDKFKKLEDDLAKTKADLATEKGKNEALKDSVKKYNEPNLYLPKATAQKYKVVDWTGGFCQHFGTFGTIDLTKLSLQRAAQLVRMKFPKLEVK